MSARSVEPAGEAGGRLSRKRIARSLDRAPEAFRDGLNEAGFEEGRNVIIDGGNN